MNNQPRKSSILQKYQPIRAQGILITLGFGAYGIVELGRCIATKEKVAIKKIGRKIVLKEVQIHRKLHHNNIIKLIDYQYDQKQECTYIILQYAQNGSLFDLIRYGGLKNKKMVKQIFYSVCIAIDYLHSMNIMHRDIKPQNILLDKNNKVKVCDFGFATQNFEPRHTICGTVQYMAPEMILKKPYSHKIDIWGLGILLFQLIQGKAPFDGKTQDEVLQKMKKNLYFSGNFLTEQMELIQKILKVDPNQRPQIKQIMKSPYLINHPKLSIQSVGKVTISTAQRKSNLSEQYQKEEQKRKINRDSKEQGNRIKIIKVTDLNNQKQKSDKKNSYNIQITSVRELDQKERMQFNSKNDKQKSEKFIKHQRSEKGQKSQKSQKTTHTSGNAGNKKSLRDVNPQYSHIRKS